MRAQRAACVAATPRSRCQRSKVPGVGKVTEKTLNALGEAASQRPRRACLPVAHLACLPAARRLPATHRVRPPPRVRPHRRSHVRRLGGARCGSPSPVPAHLRLLAAARRAGNCGHAARGARSAGPGPQEHQARSRACVRSDPHACVRLTRPAQRGTHLPRHLPRARASEQVPRPVLLAESGDAAQAAVGEDGYPEDQVGIPAMRCRSAAHWLRRTSDFEVRTRATTLVPYVGALRRHFCRFCY